MAPGSRRTDPRAESQWIVALNAGLDLPEAGPGAVIGAGVEVEGSGAVGLGVDQ